MGEVLLNKEVSSGQFTIHRLTKDDEHRFMLLLRKESEAYATAWISKPYPNEHACRLVSPNGADEDGKWARIERKHDGKAYSVIRMPKDGKLTDQAFRYPKSTWKESEARKHCEAHNGMSFEAAIKKSASDSIQRLNGMSLAGEKLAIWMSAKDGDTLPSGELLELVDQGTLHEHRGAKVLVANSGEELMCWDEGETLRASDTMQLEMTVKSTDGPEYIIGGIVYAANKEDAHEEMMEPHEVWKMMKHFMLNGRHFTIEHGGESVDLPIVEAFFTESETSKNGQNIPPGAFWLSVYAGEHKGVWEAARKGEKTGWSMEGWGRKVKAKSPEGTWPFCTCKNCGHKVEHKAGEPCADMTCPKCGGTMIPSKE